MTPSRPITAAKLTEIATPITSPANPNVRRLVRLRNHRRRRQAGRVLVDGWREVLRAAEAGLSLCGLYLPDEPARTPPQPLSQGAVALSPSVGALSPSVGALSPAVDAWFAEAAEQGCCFRLPPPLLGKIAYGQSPREVVAEFVQPDRSLEQLHLGQNPLLLVLDQIEKPGNLGAVFRCADAAGIDAVILSDGSGDLFNPNAIRSSLGTVFTVPAAVGEAEAVSQFLHTRRLRVLAARVESSTPLWSTDFHGPLAIVLGSEAGGLGDRWQTVGQTPVAGIQIPMRGRADSLNVSASAAVIAYEAIRCRLHANAPSDRSDQQNR